MKHQIFYIIVILTGLFVGGYSMHAQSVRWDIPDSTYHYLDTVLIPVYLLDTPASPGPVSFTSTVSVSSLDMEILDIETSGTIAENLGSVSHLVEEVSNSYKLTVSAAGAVGIQNKGVLYYIRGRVLGNGTISFVDQNIFDQGDPVVTPTNGSISVIFPPNIFVSPNTANLLIGEQLTFSVGGSDGPYTFDVRDANLASISSVGLFEALAQGVTRVRARGQSNSEDWSGDITIYSLGMSVADTQVIHGSTFEVPVHLENPEALDLFAGDYTFTYDSDLFTFQGINQAQTLLDGKAVQLSVDSTARFHEVHLSFASAQALSSGPILNYLHFRAKNRNQNIQSTIDLTSASLNQNLSVLRQGGQIQIQGANASLIPSGNFSILVGETIQFSSSGGQAPFQWSVLPKEVGIVRPDGLFIARSTGSCVVQVVDANGITLQSGQITVSDSDVHISSLCANANETFLLPIFYDALSENDPLLAFTMTVQYDTSDLDFVGVESTDSKSDGWVTLSNEVGDEIILTAAGTQAVPGSEPLIFLEFTSATSFSQGDIASVSIQQCLLNEGSPSARLFDGSVRYSAASIDAIVAGSATSCDPETALFNQNLTVTYTNPPGSGDLILNGQSFPITGSPQQITLQNLRGNGQDVEIFASFSEGPTCGYSFPNVFTAPSCQITVLHVDSASEGDETGATWHHAYTSFEDALSQAAASPGNYEIWVAAGTYIPPQISGRSSSFILPENTKIFGHHAGFEQWKDQRDLSTIYNSVLSGDLGNDGDSTNNSYHVIRSHAADTSFVDGFIITDGYANGSGIDGNGAGILLEGTLSLRNCVITGNESTREGSGIFVRGIPNALLLLQDCLITENQGTKGPFECELGGRADINTNVTIE